MPKAADKRVYVQAKFQCATCSLLSNKRRYFSLSSVGAIITKENKPIWKHLISLSNEHWKKRKLCLNMKICKNCALRLINHNINSSDDTNRRSNVELDENNKKLNSNNTSTLNNSSKRISLNETGKLMNIFNMNDLVLTNEQKLQVLNGNPTFEELIHRMKQNQYKNIIVIAGAGISVSAGIPDFRTKGIGLYHTLERNYGFKLREPEDIFDITYFREKDPRPFFTLVKELMPDPKKPKYKPTLSHYFIKALHDKNLLLRCYTQNIDGLERLAGIPPDKLVEAHGTFSTASCIDCKKPFDVEKYLRPRVNLNKLPFCDRCNPKEDSTIIPYKGLIKNDIVFFGEDLPNRFYSMAYADFPKADLLIVMGTSLQVYPVAGLVHRISPITPRLLINMNAVSVFNKDKEEERNNYRDVCLLDTCDNSCHKIMKALGWSLPESVHKEPKLPHSSAKKQQKYASQSWMTYVEDLVDRIIKEYEETG
jgi:NAD-dependent deacetylase sirtuin 2